MLLLNGFLFIYLFISENPRINVPSSQFIIHYSFEYFWFFFHFYKHLNDYIAFYIDVQI